MNHKLFPALFFAVYVFVQFLLYLINEEKQVYRTSTSGGGQEQQHSSRIAFLQSLHGDFQRLDGRPSVEKAFAD